MKLNKQLLLRAGTLLGIAALAFAHHVPVGLSHVSGSEILREVVFFTDSGVFGVPAYKVGDAEAPDHGEPVGLVDGDSFTVRDQTGRKEKIRLKAADFADISTADMDEVIEVINDKSKLFDAAETNGYLVLNGLVGGSTASIETSDGAGGPLFKMGMGGGTVLGSDDLELTISIPDPNLDFAGRPYMILASTTDGSMTIGRQTIPIGSDAFTSRFMRAARDGDAVGFVGVLDANGDASAHLTASQIQQMFAGGYPDKLYLSYVVLGPGPQSASSSTRIPGRIAYVSNRFTVDFQ